MHPASFMFRISKVQDFGNFELSPMGFECFLIEVQHPLLYSLPVYLQQWVDTLHGNSVNPDQLASEPLIMRHAF